jgi:hypothetical protein
MDQQTVLSHPDLTGTDYRSVLTWFHRGLTPSSYFEIGTLDGKTLELAHCKSLAVDPNFIIAGADVMANKPLCLLYQMTSDAFFDTFDPVRLLDDRIRFAFLDGMHRCEFLLRDFMNTERSCVTNSVIAMHDCIPVETAMAERVPFCVPAIAPHRAQWWTGDVWRTVMALKHFRPDLAIYPFDAHPTGLVCITNLNPTSRVLFDRYEEIRDYMFSLDLNHIGIDKYFNSIGVRSTALIEGHENLTKYFWV